MGRIRRLKATCLGDSSLLQQGTDTPRIDRLLTENCCVRPGLRKAVFRPRVGVLEQPKSGECSCLHERSIASANSTRNSAASSTSQWTSSACDVLGREVQRAREGSPRMSIVRTDPEPMGGAPRPSSLPAGHGSQPNRTPRTSFLSAVRTRLSEVESPLGALEFLQAVAGRVLQLTAAAAVSLPPLQAVADSSLRAGRFCLLVQRKGVVLALADVRCTPTDEPCAIFISPGRGL